MTLTTQFIPASQTDSKRLMIVMHGLGDSLAGYTWLPELLGLPWLNYLLVNAPDPYYSGYSWYDFAGDPRPGIERSRELLFHLLDQEQRKGFRAESTVLFGFSQGCLMTLEVGGKYPQKLAALIGISGYVHAPTEFLENLSPVARAQRFLVTHGTYDPLIPLTEVRGQIELLKSAGLKIEWHEFQKNHTIAGEAELSVIRQFLRATDWAEKD